MLIPNLGFVLLFVSDPIKSADFYAQIFNLKPLEQSPPFALFALLNGVMLDLWFQETALPVVNAKLGSSEICFAENNINELYNQCLKFGISMAQSPTDMDFGHTFVALDPDEHRIRIYKLHEQI